MLDTTIIWLLVLSNTHGIHSEQAVQNDTESTSNPDAKVLDDDNSCKQIDDVPGVCRPTRTCLRQQPGQKVWNACKWKDGQSAPSKICCYSEEQFNDRLFKETNEYQDSSDYDDYESEQAMCGMPKIFSSLLMSYQSKKKRSEDKSEDTTEDKTEIYDLLFPTAYRIVMGNSVRLGQIPWMGSIYNQHQFVCGGSIIDEWHMITAAHCFEVSRSPDEFYVRVGSVLLHNGTIRSVDKIFVHEKYFIPRIYHDIAIVRVKSRFIFSDQISPICLPRANWINKKKLHGRVAYVSGFGDVSFGGGHPAPTLQQTDLIVLNNSFCENNYHNLIDNRIRFPVGMKGSLICAGHEQGGKDACQGDSGGPLTTHVDGVSYLIGIVSFGYKCAQARFPGVYTYVTFYLNWIRQIIDSV